MELPQNVVDRHEQTVVERYQRPHAGIVELVNAVDVRQKQQGYHQSL